MVKFIPTGHCGDQKHNLVHRGLQYMLWNQVDCWLLKIIIILRKFLNFQLLKHRKAYQSSTLFSFSLHICYYLLSQARHRLHDFEQDDLSFQFWEFCTPPPHTHTQKRVISFFLFFRHLNQFLELLVCLYYSWHLKDCETSLLPKESCLSLTLLIKLPNFFS